MSDHQKPAFTNSFGSYRARAGDAMINQKQDLIGSARNQTPNNNANITVDNTNNNSNKINSKEQQNDSNMSNSTSMSTLLSNEKDDINFVDLKFEKEIGYIVLFVKFTERQIILFCI
jgi:secreted Zn-dependent insulinase-like peptidase